MPINIIKIKVNITSSGTSIIKLTESNRVLCFYLYLIYNIIIILLSLSYLHVLNHFYNIYFIFYDGKNIHKLEYITKYQKQKN